MSKTRFISLITYHDAKTIEVILNDKKNMVVGYCYILHDKDLKEDGSIKEPHIHLCIRLTTSREPEEICRWFKINEINTFAERVFSRAEVINYLTHKNNPEKFQYPIESIVNRNGIESFAENGNDALEMYLDAFNGIIPREMVRKYGRDFLYHHKQIYELVNCEKGFRDDIFHAVHKAVFDRAFRMTYTILTESGINYDGLYVTIKDAVEKTINNMTSLEVCKTYWDCYDEIYETLFNESEVFKNGQN